MRIRALLVACLVVASNLIVLPVHADPLPSFTITPSGGIAGLNPALRSVTPCPTGLGERAVRIQSSVQPPNPNPRPDDDLWVVREDGSWSMALTAARSTPPGEYQIRASCVQFTDGFNYTVTQEYAPVTWVVTAPAQPPTVSTDKVAAHGTFTIKGWCPDPGNRVHVMLIDSKENEFGAGSTTDLDPISRSWSMTVSVDQMEAPNGSYRIRTQCADPDYDVGVDLRPALPTLSFADGQVMILPQVYVSLGDSYSSGEANPPFDKGTDVKPHFGAVPNMCHRSSDAWPRRIGVLQSYHLACSGAVISDLTSGGPNGAPDDEGQIVQLRSKIAELAKEKRSADVITLTISGNDIGFKSILTSCRNPIGGCLSNLDTDIAKVNAQRARITGSLLTIRHYAPHAQIYLVGYPRIFPKAQKNNKKCDWLTSAERERLNKLAAAIDAMEKGAVEDTGWTLDTYRPRDFSGFKYVSVSDALAGHELCTTDSWMFPVSSLQAPIYDQRQAHPIKEGQDAIAAIVKTEIAKHYFAP
jgi:lysophospholipase L1-like esterase